jgi:PAS domain S-box-containing protein
MNKVFGLTRSLITLIFFFCALLVFLIWNQLRIQIARDREETVSLAIQKNSNLAVSLEQYAIRTIKTSDAFLQLVKMEYEKNEGNIDLTALLNKGIIDKNFYSSLAILDEKGKVIFSDFEGFKAGSPDLSDREHFFSHKTRKDELFISKPLVSRTSGKAVIVLSRRIDLPDGNFGGTVAMQLEPSTFTQFYSRANLKENDIISLISPDGITYARRTGKKESFGENISSSPLFGHVAKNPVNSFFAKDALKGIPTYFSYRKLENYPVIATVGTAEKDVLAGFRERANRNYVFGAIVTILLLLFPFLMSMILIQRKKVFKKIRISEKRYRSIFENSQDAFLVIYPDGRLRAMNKAAMKLFFLPDLPFTGQPFTILFNNSIPSFQLDPDITIPYNPLKEEIIFTRHDDSQFTGEVAYSGYKDYSGNQQLVIMIRDISFRKEMQQKLVMEQKKYEQELTKQIILAQEREREAIGHEMHDNVNQVLTTVKLYLELSLHKPEMREELLPRCIEHILICITEIRNLSRELSAPTLGTQSLMDSVSSLVEMVSGASGIKIHFDSLGYHTSLIKDQTLAIYRILQEQFNNIIKHASATEVIICLSQHAGKTELTIQDNGVGFDVDAKRKGIGLNNILSRTKVFGGELSIDSFPGKGTLLKVILPIQASEKQEEGIIEKEGMVEENELSKLDE